MAGCINLQKEIQQLVHRCGGSTLLLFIVKSGDLSFIVPIAHADLWIFPELHRVSRLTADMNMSASTKTPSFYRQMTSRARMGVKTTWRQQQD